MSANATYNSAQGGQVIASVVNTFLDPSGNTVAVSVANPMPTSAGGGGAANRSFVYLPYKATATATGYNTGDLIQQIEEYNTATTPSTYVDTIWRNVTQETTLAGAPLAANIVPVSATASAVSITNIGRQASANSLPVVLSTDGPGSSASSPVYVSGSGSSPVITGFTAMTVGTTYSSGIALQIICTIAGSVNIQLLNGTTFSLAVSPGYYLLPYAVTQIVTSGTTATATYGNMASTASSTSSSFSSSVPMTLGTVYSAASALQVQCTIAGNVTITLANATTMVIPVPVGYSLFPFSVTEVATASGPATATYTNLS